MEINIGMSECHKNVDNYYGSNITVWIPRCAGREAFDGVEPLPKYKQHLFAFLSTFYFGSSIETERTLLSSKILIIICFPSSKSQQSIRIIVGKIH